MAQDSAPYAGRTKQISIASLQNLPIIAKNVSPILIDIISKKARTDPYSIQPIRVGMVGESAYVLNDMEVVEGLRTAGISHIDALVTRYGSMHDIMAAHVRANLVPHGIDPLRIRPIVDYLAGSGADRDEIFRILWLDRRPDLLAAIRADITDEARRILTDLVEQISTRVYDVITPAYYITMLGRIVKNEQAEAALQLKALTLLNIRKSGFSWHTADSVRIALSQFHREIHGVPVEDRIIHIEKDWNPPEPKKRGRTKIKSPRKDARMVEMAGHYIIDNQNLSYVHITGKHPDLIVDRKRNRIMHAVEKNGTYSMVGDAGNAMHVLPNHVTRHLGADHGEPVIIHKYDSVEGAKKALSRIKEKNGHYVILSTTRIPRR